MIDALARVPRNARRPGSVAGLVAGDAGEFDRGTVEKPGDEREGSAHGSTVRRSVDSHTSLLCSSRETGSWLIPSSRATDVFSEEPEDSRENRPGSPGNCRVLQRIFAARTALAPPRLLPCIDAGKLPDGRRFDPVQHFLSLPLKRRSG